jgi:hypothetical protein
MIFGSSLLLFVFIAAAYAFDIICIYLRILVLNMISMSDDVRVI